MKMLHTVTYLLWHCNPLLTYSILAFILALESTGIPIVNSTLLLLAGAMASQGHGNIWLLGLASILGSIIGACVAYQIGARGGRQLFLKTATRLHIDAQKVTMLEHWFQRSGVWMIFLSRIIPYIRPFACFPAGIAHTPFSSFFASASIGSIIWCIGMLTIGWNLGARWRIALDLLSHYTLPFIVGLVLLLLLYILAMRAMKSRLHTHMCHCTADEDTRIRQMDPLSV